MRTTVTLDADTEQLIRRRMRERGMSFKATLNEAIRNGLGSALAVEHETPVRNLGRAKVNLDHALELVGDLEDEELLRKQRIGK